MQTNRHDYNIFTPWGEDNNVYKTTIKHKLSVPLISERNSYTLYLKAQTALY